MYPRFYKPLKDKSFFLFGPRGTGKTTWLKHLFSTENYIDLLNEDTYRLLMGSSKRLMGMVRDPKKWVIIDEVQKCPNLLDEVHRLIESEKMKFILTGSSARKLKRGGANLLAGRAFPIYFSPLTVWELGDHFSLPLALKYGLLPAVWQENQNNEDKNRFLSGYISTYLKDEIHSRKQEKKSKSTSNQVRNIP